MGGLEFPSTPGSREATSPPGTPRPAHRTLLSPPNTPGLTRSTSRPEFLRALENNDLEAVSHVLTKDPDAAATLLWDYGCEPPLCAAVRLGCDASIIKYLLSHGADVAAVDSRGRTVLTLLACQGPLSEGCVDRLAVARALLDAGVDPKRPDEGGRLPADLAAAFGNANLACFLRYRTEVLSCRCICRASTRSPPIAGLTAQLPSGVWQVVCSMLIPIPTWANSVPVPHKPVFKASLLIHPDWSGGQFKWQAQKTEEKSTHKLDNCWSFPQLSLLQGVGA